MGATDENDRALERLVGEQAEERVRRVWHEGRWWFSVVDAVGLLSEAASARTYWAQLKAKLSAEGGRETLQALKQLRMRAADGKQRLTDAADTETLLRIIQSIPSPRAEPFKQWLAHVGAQRLEELENPAVAADSLRLAYRKKGYTEEWIETRLRNIMTRDEVTAEWRVRGAEEGREFAILTDVLHRGTFALSVREHQQIKHLPARANLRDNMTTLELALSTLAEATSAALHQARDSSGFVELQRDAGEAGEVAGAARSDIEARTGQPVVSSQNAKHLTARAEQPPLLLAPDDDASAGDS